VADDVNKIKNPDFSLGKKLPRGWTWSATRSTMDWSRSSDNSANSVGITITSRDVEDDGSFTQVVVVKPGEHYRIDVTVSADLEPQDEDGGCVLSVQPVLDGESDEGFVSTPPLSKSTQPIAIRTYYEADGETKRLRIAIGVRQAQGTLHIHHVRVYKIIEPELESHILAVDRKSVV